MRAPTSSVLSEIYLQHLENTEICNLLIKHNIEGHFRYVDDIIIIYNENITNVSDLLDCFNKLNPKLVFTIEREKDRKINVLDITIYKEQSKLSTDIYRKPTFTDVIIPNDSCHHKEHKMAAIGSYIIE
jgi:hypothetical protein